MAVFERYQPGQFSWVDLMTPDLDATTHFYGSLLGWGFEHTQDDHGGAYTMCRLKGVDVAGMATMPEDLQKAGVPPHWSSYVTVENADASTERAQELGGRVEMSPMDLTADGELVGRMAILADPSGARISIWQPGRHVGSGLANVPGSLAWNELCTRDADGAAKFYESLFGWKIMEGDAENGYRAIMLGDRLNGGILPWQPQMGDMPPAWTPYFAVEDCDKAIAKVKDLGGQLLMGPVDIDAGRFAVMMDPQGAVFNMMYLVNPDD